MHGRLGGAAHPRRRDIPVLREIASSVRPCARSTHALMSAARPCGGGPFRRDRGCAPVIQTRTANLTLYPKVNVLVIGPDALERLTAEQRDLLRQAADDVRELAIRDLPDEREAAAAYCDFGGGVALTTDDALAELRDAVTPVYAELEADSSTATVLDRIVALKASLPQPVAQEIATCEADVALADGPPFEIGEPDDPLPEGVLRTEMTEDQLRERGVPESYVAAYRGIYTLTMRDGSWFTDGEEDEPGTYDFGGSTPSTVTSSRSASPSPHTKPSAASTTAGRWTATSWSTTHSSSSRWTSPGSARAAPCSVATRGRRSRRDQDPPLGAGRRRPRSLPPSGPGTAHRERVRRRRRSCRRRRGGADGCRHTSTAGPARHPAPRPRRLRGRRGTRSPPRPAGDRADLEARLRPDAVRAALAP
jgi:hypothetical protein